jgi:hypothetical protein
MVIVGHVLPHFWARVVRCSGLSAQHPFLGDLGDIEIAELYDASFGEEEICTLNIAVTDFQIVERFEPPDNLDKMMPYHFLTQK